MAQQRVEIGSRAYFELQTNQFSDDPQLKFIGPWWTVVGRCPQLLFQDLVTGTSFPVPMNQSGEVDHFAALARGEFAQKAAEYQAAARDRATDNLGAEGGIPPAAGLGAVVVARSGAVGLPPGP